MNEKIDEGDAMILTHLYTTEGAHSKKKAEEDKKVSDPNNPDEAMRKLLQDKQSDSK
jgi:hypothetical protein